MGSDTPGYRVRDTHGNTQGAHRTPGLARVVALAAALGIGMAVATGQGVGVARADSGTEPDTGTSADAAPDSQSADGAPSAVASSTTSDEPEDPGRDRGTARVDLDHDGDKPLSGADKQSSEPAADTADNGESEFAADLLSPLTPTLPALKVDAAPEVIDDATPSDPANSRVLAIPARAHDWGSRVGDARIESASAITTALIQKRPQALADGERLANRTQRQLPKTSAEESTAISMAADPIDAKSLPTSRDPVDALLAAPVAAMTTFVRAVLSFVTPGPAAPSGPPALLAVLEWARREIQRTFVNRGPTAIRDDVTTSQGTATVIDPLTNDVDPDGGDVLTITGVTQPSNGRVVVNVDGTLTYTPNAGFTGQDAFSYTVDDASNFHLHGLSGLVHALTFGLLGHAGHTDRAEVTVQVTAQGSFPVSLVNNTGGVYSDDEIFVTIIGQAGQSTLWSWVDADGTAHPLDHNAANAEGHLQKNGVNYANMSFTLAESATMRIPPQLLGGRIYITKGEPLYLTIDANNNWSINSADPNDPNYHTAWDFFELAYQYEKVPFGGDPSYVDHFSMAMTSTLEQALSGHSTTRGLPLLTATVYERYTQTLPAAFQALIVKDAAGKPVRILSPRTATPGELATWLDEPVNDFWTKYKTEQFTYTGPGNAYTVTGGINANHQFAYTIRCIDSGGCGGDIKFNDVRSYTTSRPASPEIFAANGVFVGGDPMQGAFLTQLNAAFNRGVATSPDQWATVSAYYPEGQRWNDYAKLLHDLSLEHLSYAMPYDDANNQSGVQILTNPQPPDRLTISIR